MKNSNRFQRLALVVLTSSLIFAAGNNSDAQSRIRKFARFAAPSGWTLKQKKFYTPVGGVKRLVGEDIYYFQGRDQWVLLRYGAISEGSFLLFERLFFIPKAVFRANTGEKTLSFLNEPTDIFFGVDIDESVMQTWKNYIGDESILGWRCAVLKNTEIKDQITTSYHAYNLAGFTIKYIRSDPEGIEMVEPASITLGPISADLSAFPSDWPIDFSWYEQLIQKKEQTGLPEVPAMKEILTRAQARFIRKEN